MLSTSERQKLLPATVTIREVGPRDGLQNEPERVVTAGKVRLIDALSATGLKRIELTSFVSAGAVPQLADAEDVLERYEKASGVSYTVLIPNMHGLERALKYRDRFDEIDVFLSASESHNRKNLNRSIEESLAGLKDVLKVAGEEGLRREGVISVAFGCPYEGVVERGRVLDIAKKLASYGCDEVTFGDTTGMANPLQVAEFFTEARKALGDGIQLTAHFHNTRGQGLANVLGALGASVGSFESSIGELGGCPVPAGATGNIASEDLVSMLQEMGIETGIDLDALLGCARLAQEALGRPLSSHLLKAGPADWHRQELS